MEGLPESTFDEPARIHSFRQPPFQRLSLSLLGRLATQCSVNRSMKPKQVWICNALLKRNTTRHWPLQRFMCFFAEAPPLSVGVWLRGIPHHHYFNTAFYFDPRTAVLICAVALTFLRALACFCCHPLLLMHIDCLVCWTGTCNRWGFMRALYV